LTRRAANAARARLTRGVMSIPTHAANVVRANIDTQICVPLGNTNLNFEYYYSRSTDD